MLPMLAVFLHGANSSLFKFRSMMSKTIFKDFLRSLLGVKQMIFMGRFWRVALTRSKKSLPK